MKKFIFFTIFTWFIQGCATQDIFEVTVDSISSPFADNKTYILLPGNDGVSAGDLQFQEYSLYLMRVLHSKGFRPAKTSEEADIAIVLFYGIGEPETNYYSYALPVWGQTGVQSSNTSGTATVYGNTASYNETTTNVPQYGITGYTSATGSYTEYNRYALIAAYDYEKYRADYTMTELWKTTVTSSGSSGDLRRVFPVMMAAAAQYIGDNSGQQVTIELLETDEIMNIVNEPIKFESSVLN